MPDVADFYIRFDPSPNTLLTDIAVCNKGDGNLKVSILVRPDKDDDSKTLTSTFGIETGVNSDQMERMTEDASNNNQLAMTVFLGLASFGLLEGIRPGITEEDGVIQSLSLDPAALIAAYGLMTPCSMQVLAAMQAALDSATSPEQSAKMVTSMSDFNRNIAEARSQLIAHAMLGDDGGPLVLLSGVAAVVFNTIVMGSSFMLDIAEHALTGSGDRAVGATGHSVH